MLLYSVKTTFVAHACQDIYLLLEYGHLSERSLAKLQKLLSETMPDDALERMFFAERVYQIKLGRVLMPENITSLFLQDKTPDLPVRTLATPPATTPSPIKPTPILSLFTALALPNVHNRPAYLILIHKILHRIIRVIRQTPHPLV